MEIQYVKRYEMIFDFSKSNLLSTVLPENFHWIPWHLSLCNIHGRVKYLSFRHEIDAEIFPTFTRYDSCVRLMQTIAMKPEFLPGTTWMIGHRVDNGPLDYCATIQGLRKSRILGAIQNVAVIPNYRKLGLGHALVSKCLYGFQEAGCQLVTLEVTVENGIAIRLYSELGFKITRTVYKEVFR